MGKIGKITLNNHIRNIVALINDTYTPDAASDWLSETIERYHHPQRFKTEEEVNAEIKSLLIPLFDEFLLKHKLSEVRQKNFRVIRRALQRYELYVRATKRGQKQFVLNVDDVTSDTLRDIWNFFENEYIYYDNIPQSTSQYPKSECRRRAAEIR